ncbi:serine/threonine-protein phosphatase [Pseudomonas quasicaspiana]|nr:serine/threonine-protein phosphatase [Pseudomonas syringae]MDG6403622.1 serine/threonine-protein phosphatase [Pseudomonas quasicaspiana]
MARRCASVGRTERGKVRERNEDAYLNSPEHGLWVVADGMGGHQCGDLASQLIVSSVAAIARYTHLDDRLFAVRECLRGVNHRLGKGVAARAGDSAPVMGSTVVALLIEGPRAVCVWAGDSRCYLWREQRLYQLTRDHSLLQKLIADEHMCSREAAQHPGAHALTRAVGGGDGLSLEVIELDVRCGDVFVLCSDGLYQAVDHQVLGNALNNRSPRLTVDLLFDHVLRGPASDNLTAVVVRT